MKSSNTSTISIYPESQYGSEGESIKSTKSIHKSIHKSMHKSMHKSIHKSISEVMATESKSKKHNSNKRSEDKLPSKNDENNWWKVAVTEYAFNLPPVRKNLNRLICTDRVQLTDHKFMFDLRNRVWNEFDERLTEKTKQREFLEIERTKTLILKCSYNVKNCPRKLIPLHSTVLALDLGSTEATPKIAKDTRRPNEYDGHVFNINRRTNVSIRLRRMKLKSIRKRNFEYLMRQLRKGGNAIRLKYDQMREIQENMKNIRNSIMEKKQKKAKKRKV